MLIGLHDADAEHLKHKNFPNYPFMKVSAYHKSRNDIVEWWNPLLHYDKVYSSKIFDFNAVNPYLPQDAIKGGTGYSIKGDLPDKIDGIYPNYSIYSKLVRKDLQDVDFRVQEPTPRYFHICTGGTQ